MNYNLEICQNHILTTIANRPEMKSNEITSKILICDADPEGARLLEEFCENNNLLAFSVSEPYTLPMVLESNIGLGGIFLSQEFGGSDGWIIAAEVIRSKRPELPIFFRRTGELDSLPEATNQFTGVFHLDSLADLHGLIEEHLRTTWYPESFVRRVQEITIATLSKQFCFTDVECDLSYVAKDQLTHDKLISIIPIDSNWCRGYMMLQVKKDPVNHAILGGRTFMREADCNDGFRAASQILSEITNQSWGAMKNEFFSTKASISSSAQVPIIMNYDLDHISFGSSAPQLCFDYSIEHRDEMLPPFSFYQKFIFNLMWSPELFNEEERAMHEISGTGEIELF